MIRNRTILTEQQKAEGLTTGFDYLRLGLSVAVLVWHSILLTAGPAAYSGLWSGPFRFIPAAILPMFFALSGFLVTGSLMRTNIHHFLALRAIRLVPALAVEVTLSALILGVAFTTMPLREYFTSRNSSDISEISLACSFYSARRVCSKHRAACCQLPALDRSVRAGMLRRDRLCLAGARMGTKTVVCDAARSVFRRRVRRGAFHPFHRPPRASARARPRYGVSSRSWRPPLSRCDPLHPCAWRRRHADFVHLPGISRRAIHRGVSHRVSNRLARPDAPAKASFRRLVVRGVPFSFPYRTDDRASLSRSRTLVGDGSGGLAPDRALRRTVLDSHRASHPETQGADFVGGRPRLRGRAELDRQTSPPYPRWARRGPPRGPHRIAAEGERQRLFPRPIRRQAAPSPSAC